MKARKFTIVLIVVLLVIGSNSACSLGALGKPTPTNTPLPTATNTPLPTATNTPLPTATNTPIPTATPDLEATQAAQNEQIVRDILVELELPDDTGHLGWYQEESISIALQGLGSKWKTFDDDFSAGDFVLYSEMTWKTNDWPTCGVMFRSDDHFGDGTMYLLQFLRFSGLPAWDIEYIKNGNYITTITNQTQFSDYLNIDDGATNKFVLVANGNEFKVYVDGNFEGQYYDWSKKISDGKIAFYAFHPSGSTTCTFANSWIWIYK